MKEGGARIIDWDLLASNVKYKRYFDFFSSLISPGKKIKFTKTEVLFLLIKWSIQQPLQS